MKIKNRTMMVVGALLVVGVSLAGWISGCGKALPLDVEGFLGDAVIGDGGSRTDGSDFGAIYPVTTVVAATAGPAIPGFTPPGDLPFPEAAIGFNDFTLNRQVPHYYTFTFPPNNYQLSQAHLVIDTNRDSSDTEGIFVDGVLTGRPPGANTTCPKTTNFHQQGNHLGNPVNSFYMTYSLNHYLQSQRNTFTLDIAQLLLPTATTIYDVLNDGFLPVVTADDSPVYQAFLTMDGYTISQDPLTCSNAGPFTFENVYVHQDGNSIASPAFSGTVETPFQSTTSVVPGFKSIEFYFDPALPRGEVGNVTLNTGHISMTVRRNTDEIAIVVNGIGVSTAGFNRTQATAVVEQWDDSTTASNYLTTWLAGIPTTMVNTAVTLDLDAMLGATVVRDLIAQGKFNIALAGGIRYVAAGNNASARTFGVTVSGPNLDVDGTYVTETCTIPDDPDSPITGGGILPPDPGDTTSPQVISAQATNITSNSASIVWLTDEGATSQVEYGIGTTDTLTANDPTLVTFHEVNLTGLLPYKYYYFKVRTADGNANLTVSSIKVFRTLR